MMKEIYEKEIYWVQEELKGKAEIAIVIIDQLDELIGKIETYPEPQVREIVKYWEAQRAKVDAQKTAYCEMLTQLEGCKKPEEYPIQ